jgi:ribosomal protein S18 acetylase RimI-like enzyme
MIDLSPPYRRAAPTDAPELAVLVNMAGEGLPLYLWTKMAEPDEDPWEVGSRRAQRDSGSFSYRNAVMMEQDGSVVGCLIGYPLSAEPEPINYDETPPMFVPLQELENLAPGTWYVNVLAVYPEHRGRGYGGQLLSLAERVANDSGCSAMSIIVSGANAGARRLYERAGYTEAAERPMVKDGWSNPGQNWVLLVKGFSR